MIEASSTPIADALVLAAVGITVVFAVLMLLIGAVQLLARTYGTSGGVSQPTSVDSPSPRIARAIAAAVQHHHNKPS